MKKSLYIEIFLVSLAAILLEITYTRVFSFKVWYYFTYLIIGIALLGLGTGGVLAAIVRPLRKAEPARLVPIFCFLGGISVLVGYLVIANTQLNIIKLGMGSELGKLVWICLLLMTPFLLTGIIISKILSTSPEVAGRLYGADLLGAGLGCIICIPLLMLLDPPRTVILAGFIFAIAGLRMALRSRLMPVVGAAICAILIVPVIWNDLLPDIRVDPGKSYGQLRDKNRVVFSKWHPVFRVDVVKELAHDVLLHLYHDGQAGSALWHFGGDLASLKPFEKDARTVPFEMLPERPEVLIIGSAGGIELLVSLYSGANHVTGVELNPVTISLLTDHYAEYTGNIAENPRITLINGEGRWFISQSDKKYDLIWFVAPDSYASMNASSAAGFVLAESYLYTVEMLQESLRHLSEDGIICAQFGELAYDLKPNRTARFAVTAREAFLKEGVSDFENHVAVSSSTGGLNIPLSTVILSKSPLTFEQVRLFRKKIPQLGDGKIRYTPGESDNSAAPVNQAITLPESFIKNWIQEYPYIISPVYDDSPYFWHFGRFRDAFASREDWGRRIDLEDCIAERVSIALLSVATLFAAVFLMLPFVIIHKTWTGIPHKLRAGIYFAALGLGFMFIEVALIQMLTLFLGYPTHSLSVTLFGLLVFSGIGSIRSERYTARPGRALGILMLVLVAIIAFYQFGIPVVVENFIGQPFIFRVLLTIAMIAPLGFCLGAFMPTGLKVISGTTPNSREYVAWAWGINGFFSVMASILATILAMAIGFKLVLAFALLLYAGGVVALTGIIKRSSVVTK